MRVAEADAAIRRTVSLVARGLANEVDVEGELRMHNAARDAARDDLALLPVPMPLPSITPADLAAFRARVLAGIAAQPIARQRAALGALVSSVTLSPGVATLRYRPRLGSVADPGVAPHGGPSGAW